MHFPKHLPQIPGWRHDNFDGNGAADKRAFDDTGEGRCWPNAGKAGISSVMSPHEIKQRSPHRKLALVGQGAPLREV